MNNDINLPNVLIISNGFTHVRGTWEAEKNVECKVEETKMNLETHLKSKHTNRKKVI